MENSIFLDLTLPIETAKKINNMLMNIGITIPKGRFIIAVFKGDLSLGSGIIIPDQAEESKPKIGTIVYQQPGDKDVNYDYDIFVRIS